MGGVEDFSLLHRPFLCLGACELFGLAAHQCFCVWLATVGCGEPFEMCFCLGSGAFSWNNRCLCPDVCGVRPHSPIGRDRGLKILVFWVRVPVGARHRHAWTCGIDKRRLFPWGRGRRLRIWDFVVCFLELKGDAPDPYYRGHRGVAVRAIAFRALSSPRVDAIVLCRN